jgi:hypothetical protein
MALVPLVLNIVSCGLEIEFVTIPMQLPPSLKKVTGYLQLKIIETNISAFLGK